MDINFSKILFILILIALIVTYIIKGLFWSLMNYLNAKTKEDFDRILAKVKSKEEK